MTTPVTPTELRWPIGETELCAVYHLTNPLPHFRAHCSVHGWLGHDYGYRGTRAPQVIAERHLTSAHPLP